MNKDAHFFSNTVFFFDGRSFLPKRFQAKQAFTQNLWFESRKRVSPWLPCLLFVSRCFFLQFDNIVFSLSLHGQVLIVVFQLWKLNWFWSFSNLTAASPRFAASSLKQHKTCFIDSINFLAFLTAVVVLSLNLSWNYSLPLLLTFWPSPNSSPVFVEVPETLTGVLCNGGSKT